MPEGHAPNWVQDILDRVAAVGFTVSEDVANLLRCSTREADACLSVLVRENSLRPFSMGGGRGRYYVLSASEATKRGLSVPSGRVPNKLLRATLAWVGAPGDTEPPSAQARNRRLTRVLSHALRHAPEDYGLCLDADGWGDVETLLAAVRTRSTEWTRLAASDLAALIASSKVDRFELREDRIRAKYGHSAEATPGAAAEPPAVLYHATDRRAAAHIYRDGLEPRGRRFTHLASDARYAISARRVKSWPAILFSIDALAAHRSGVTFFPASSVVWLVERIPVEFLAGFEGIASEEAAATHAPSSSWSDYGIQWRRRQRDT